ncbi:MAG: zf-HC2 domain-containing protein [Cytophagaceae bacterium]
MNKYFTNLMNKIFRKEKPKAQCTECLQSLQMLVDGETTKEQESYFRKHLDECVPCYNFYNLEKSVKEVLQNKIEQRPIPPALIESVKARIKSSAQAD